MNWLLAWLCLITITGCVFKAKPNTQNLSIHEEDALPNITLTRRVVPEFGSELRTFQGKSEHVEVESKSRFGDPDEEPDLSCIHAGLRNAIPTIDIIPTATFWAQIDAPQDAVELTELFAAPQSDRLRALQVDVLVIAYHARIDLESEKEEFLYGGWISDQEKETAAVVVVDLSRKTIIHGSRITFDDIDFVGHGGYIVPLAFIVLSPPDICKTVARQAGTAIVAAMPDRPIRALVVVAREEPMRQDFEKEKRKAENRKHREKRKAENRKHAEKVAQELAILELEANKGNTDAQLKLFKEMNSKDPNRALVWLCKSADLGNQEARVTLAKIYAYGGHVWVKNSVIQQNYKLAYVWYALSGTYDQEDLRFFADRYLTSEQQIDAKKMLEDWQPGNCERELELELVQNN